MHVIEHIPSHFMSSLDELNELFTFFTIFCLSTTRATTTVNAELTSLHLRWHKNVSSYRHQNLVSVSQCKSALVSQQPSVTGMHDCFVLYPVVNLFAFGSRPQGGLTVTHNHLFLVVLLCLLCPHPSAIAVSHMPKQTVVKTEKRCFEAITPNVPGVKIALGDK